MIEVSVIHGVRRDEQPSMTGLHHGQLGFLKRYHRDSEQPFSVGRAMVGKPIVVSSKQRRRKLRMPDSSETKRVCGEQCGYIDTFAIHYPETTFAVGGHLKEIFAAGFCNEAQWKHTWRTVVAGAVAIFQARSLGQNFAQRGV